MLTAKPEGLNHQKKILESTLQHAYTGSYRLRGPKEFFLINGTPLHITNKEDYFLEYSFLTNCSINIVGLSLFFLDNSWIISNVSGVIVIVFILNVCNRFSWLDLHTLSHIVSHENWSRYISQLTFSNNLMEKVIVILCEWDIDSWCCVLHCLWWEYVYKVDSSV